MTRYRNAALAAFAAAALISAGCAKKKVSAATPPSAPQPTVTTPTPTRTPEPARAVETPRQTASTPTSKYPDAATRARIDQLLGRISDAYFDYDKHSLRPDAVKALEGDSRELRDILKDYPDYKLTIEGYADERGSAEYNLGLGDARAKAAKDYLSQVGIPGGQLNVVSYGKEKQICQDHNESCWQKNRRIHITAVAAQ
jgi:peptidoglycan-associated lipoprotein